MEFSNLNGYDVKDKTARENIDKLKDSYIIDEIETSEINVTNNNGKVYITSIPHLDSENNIIPIKHEYGNDLIDTGMEKPTDFSYRHKATFVANASVFETVGTEHIPINTLKGVYIHDGVLLKDNREYVGTDFLNNRYILGIKEDNTLKSYRGDTSVNTLLADGVKECLQSFIPILINGNNNRNNLVNEGCTYWEDSTFTETTDVTPDYDKIYYTLENDIYEGHFHLNSFEPGVTYYDEIAPTSGTALRYIRQVICQKENGDIIFITNNGKGDIYNKGLSLYDFTTLAKYYGCDFAFVLDGGGSTASIYKNQMLNHPTDSVTTYNKIYNGEGTAIREIPDFLYFSKEAQTETDHNINYLLKQIQVLNKKIEDLKLNENQKSMSNSNFYSLENEQHIMNFKKYNSTLNEFIDTFKVYVDNVGAFPGGMSLNYIDENNGTHPVIRFSKDETAGIQYLTKKLALVFNEIPKLANGTDLNNLPNLFTFARADRDQNLNGSPITASNEGYNYFILQFGFTSGSSQLRYQIAFSLNVDVIIKARCYTSNWGSWKTITVS